jgi:hypothetical protein
MSSRKVELSKATKKADKGDSKALVKIKRKEKFGEVLRHDMREHLRFFSKSMDDIKAYYGKLGAAFHQNWLDRHTRCDAKTRDVKADWTDVVDYAPDSKQKEFDGKIDLLVGEARKMVGDRPITMRQVLAGTHSAATTTGVVSGIITIDASAFTDWATLAVLFDEFKIHRGNVEWITSDATLAIPTASSIYVWCFDPVDATVLTSTQSGALSEQHKLYAVTNVNGLGAVATFHNGQPHLFKFVVPKGVMIRGTVTMADSWCATVAPVPYGYVKTYFVGSTVVNQAVTAWLASIEVTYRFRS